MKYLLVSSLLLCFSGVCYSQVELKASMFGVELNSYKGFPKQDTVIVNFELIAKDNRYINSSTCRLNSGGIDRWELTGDSDIDLSKFMYTARIGDLLNFRITTNYNDTLYLSYPIKRGFTIPVISQDNIKKKERLNSDKAEYNEKVDN